MLRPYSSGRRCGPIRLSSRSYCASVKRYFFSTLLKMQIASMGMTSSLLACVPIIGHETKSNLKEEKIFQRRGQRPLPCPLRIQRFRLGISFTPLASAVSRGGLAAVTRSHTASKCESPRAKSRLRRCSMWYPPSVFPLGNCETRFAIEDSRLRQKKLAALRFRQV